MRVREPEGKMFTSLHNPRSRSVGIFKLRKVKTDPIEGGRRLKSSSLPGVHAKVSQTRTSEIERGTSFHPPEEREQPKRRGKPPCRWGRRESPPVAESEEP